MNLTSEQTFRLILIVGALLVFPIAVYHRLKSHVKGQRLDRSREGLFILLTLRPIGIAGMIGLLAYMVSPASMAWSSMALPPALRWAGAGVGIFAGVLLIWTLRTLGRNLTDTVVTREQHSLVTSGPYQYVRHPFYDAMILSVIANSLVSANWFILVTGVIAFALLVIRSRTEEQLLLQRFGDSYREYRDRTPRFVPNLPRISRRTSFILRSQLPAKRESERN